MTDTDTFDEILDRIREASDQNGQKIHSVTKVGSDDVRDYYVVTTESLHDGREMWGVRYFAAGTVPDSEDTWMKNGLTGRYIDGVLGEVGRALVAAENRRLDDGDDHQPILSDLTDDGE